MSSTILGRWIFADTSDCEVLLRTVSRQIKKENNKKEEKRNGERERAQMGRDLHVLPLLNTLYGKK